MSKIEGPKLSPGQQVVVDAARDVIEKTVDVVKKFPVASVEVGTVTLLNSLNGVDASIVMPTVFGSGLAGIGEYVADKTAEAGLAENSLQNVNTRIQWTSVAYLLGLNLGEVLNHYLADDLPQNEAELYWRSLISLSPVGDDILGYFAKKASQRGSESLSIVRLVYGFGILIPISELAARCINNGEVGTAAVLSVAAITNLEQAVSSLPAPEDFMAHLVRKALLQKIKTLSGGVSHFDADIVRLTEVNDSLQNLIANQLGSAGTREELAKNLAEIKKIEEAQNLANEEINFWKQIRKGVFGGADRNKDGKVDLEEIRDFLFQMAGDNPDKVKELKNLWMTARTITRFLTGYGEMFKNYSGIKNLGEMFETINEFLEKSEWTVDDPHKMKKGSGARTPGKKTEPKRAEPVREREAAPEKAVTPRKSEARVATAPKVEAQRLDPKVEKQANEWLEQIFAFVKAQNDDDKQAVRDLKLQLKVEILKLLKEDSKATLTDLANKLHQDKNRILHDILTMVEGENQTKFVELFQQQSSDQSEEPAAQRVEKKSAKEIEVTPVAKVNQWAEECEKLLIASGRTTDLSPEESIPVNRLVDDMLEYFQENPDKTVRDYYREGGQGVVQEVLKLKLCDDEKILALFR